MCSRYILSKADKELLDAYNAELQEPFTPKGHVSITDRSLAITSDEPGILQPMHFSIVPHNAKHLKEFARYSLFNAKSEEILDKKLYRPLFVKHKTCLIPAEAFVEWQLNGKNKDPFRIFVRDREVFSFAGIWSRWIDPATKEPYNSFAILTTDANPLVAWIHNTKHRMPVILPKENEKLWLDKELSPADLLSLCQPYPEDLMDAIPMSQRVNVERSEDGRLQYPRNSA